ncbi:MAG TPA: hypothetical protein PK379_01090 [Candidatus Hydrogenedentes bacterium]|nr:hypothetical protein [Candidatus Hydrogenedentota bacterium]HOJ68563.1 hypothetical protein [Candidatus Hydrogenedentota bacterium]HOK88597.1 hypothetical protein [Candidatus Hydrogenedentota bacterium]HOV61506.1 hypothetical protein [Candidatus Hydrogenedentota bacterium]
MIKQCCVCGKVYEKGEWKRPATAEPRMVSHTYCPDCLIRAVMQARGVRPDPIPRPLLVLN